MGTRVGEIRWVSGRHRVWEGAAGIGGHCGTVWKQCSEQFLKSMNMNLVRLLVMKNIV